MVKHTVIASCNLIGDTLTQIPALKAYRKKHPDERITYLLHKNPGMEIMRGIELAGIADELSFVSEPNDPGNSHRVTTMDIGGGPYEKKILMEPRKAWHLSLGAGEHIAQGYGRCLGAPVEREEILPEVQLLPEDFESIAPEPEPGTLPVSIRSASSDPSGGDGFSGNKNFPIKGWLELFKRLGPTYKPVICYGPGESPQPLFAHLPAVWLPIRKLAAFLLKCGQYAGVDNGITHLAAGLRIQKMLIIYPWCLPLEWVGYSNFPFYHAARIHPHTGDVDRVWREWRDHV